MAGETLIYCFESMPNLSAGGSLLGIYAGLGSVVNSSEGISPLAAFFAFLRACTGCTAL